MHVFEILEILRAILTFGKGQTAPFSKNDNPFEFSISVINATNLVASKAF